MLFQVLPDALDTGLYAPYKSIALLVVGKLLRGQARFVLPGLRIQADDVVVQCGDLLLQRLDLRSLLFGLLLLSFDPFLHRALAGFRCLPRFLLLEGALQLFFELLKGSFLVGFVSFGFGDKI